MKVLEENIVDNLLDKGLGNDLLNLTQSKSSRSTADDKKLEIREDNYDSSN